MQPRSAVTSAVPERTTSVRSSSRATTQSTVAAVSVWVHSSTPSAVGSKLATEWGKAASSEGMDPSLPTRAPNDPHVDNVPRLMFAVLGAAAGGVVALMLVTWLISVVRRDASLVDIVWGLGFVVVAVASFATGDGSDARRTLLLVLVGVWGLRLAAYLAWRNLGHGEDRAVPGDAPALRRAVLAGQPGHRLRPPGRADAGCVAAGAASASADAPTGWARWRRSASCSGWSGSCSRPVGDLQLARFKADPAHEGQVMDRGFWRYTRHPNYFGDFCVWWGIWLVAAETGPGRWGSWGRS